MNAGILRIALLCIVFGSVSIPVSFTVNPNPIVVWWGNALGSAISALVVIFIANRITSRRFKAKVSRWRVGRKVVTLYDEGQNNTKVNKAGNFIERHGLRIFSLFCPIFPGVTISTIAVYVLDLDKKIYKKWMLAGVVFVSGAYCFGYWFIFLH